VWRKIFWRSSVGRMAKRGKVVGAGDEGVILVMWRSYCDFMSR
jgi:hypothetical protein